MKSVRAAVIEGPGQIGIREYPYPDVVADNGVLKVEATGIVGVDYEVYNGIGAAAAIPFPFIPGHVIVGTIDALGPAAARHWGVADGDRVVVRNTVACGRCANCRAGDRRRCESAKGYGLWFDFTAPPYLLGGAAEYMALHPNSEMAKVPDGISPPRACLQERLASPMHWLVRQGGLTMYDSLVVIGTGMLALAAIMVGKMAGASPCIVIGRAGSKRLGLARDVGADLVLTGREQEVVDAVKQATRGEGASVAIELTDATSPEATALAVRCLARRGRAIQVAVKDGAEVRSLTADEIINREARLIGVYGSEFADLAKVMAMLEEDRPAAMASIPLAEFSLDQAKQAMETPASSVGALMTIINPWADAGLPRGEDNGRPRR